MISAKDYEPRDREQILGDDEDRAADRSLAREVSETAQVTEEAVRLGCDAIHGEINEEGMQAALAAAYPALMAEISTLKQQRRWTIERVDGGIRICEGGHHRSQDCEFEYYVPQADRDRLAAENAALVKDAERLDWLSANPRITEAHVNGKVENAHAYVVCGHQSFTLREIIDAAIDAAARGRG